MIERLEVRGFRNLVDASIAVPSGRQLLLGPNGAGKSSLLEAIYVGATTRSFRASDLAVCRRRGGQRFEIEIEVAGRHPAHLALSRDAAGLERRLNSARSSLVDHVAAQPVVSWSEADREVLLGRPEARRRFLDRGLVAERPHLLEPMTRYRRALAHKRALLRQGGAGLAAWNEVLAMHGAELIVARRDHAARLAVVVGALARLEQPALEVALRYRSAPRELAEAEDVAAALYAALEETVEREVELGRTLVGPHRDRVEISWRGLDIAAAASAGERKLAGWILTVARAELVRSRGLEPVLLLDDADAELDPVRLERLWSLLPPSLQVLASSSRPELWQSLPRTATWTLDEGHVSITSH